MNNSQNSDIFVENSMIEYTPWVVNGTPYKLLLTKTLQFLSTESTFKEPAFSQNFTLCLEDCGVCVCQCLEVISSTVESTENQSVEIQSYLADAVILLQKLSCFLKTLTESVALSCTSLKTFPTTTGQIILSVFTHCKDSEYLYNDHLKIVETELKDLFRTCHELQHTYLLILEKHFIFDMMEEEQRSILLKALDINMKTTEIVQTLDVKTLAEQLKAFTEICNKYSDSLIDEDIYNQCTELLCGLIANNLKTALEINQEDKIVLRSLKIASFIIKILIKVSDIFKHGVKNNYDFVVQTLIYIYMCDGTILGEVLNKSPYFISQVNILILGISQELLSQLLLDKRFSDSLFQCDIRKVSEDKQHGLLLLLISTIRCCLQNADNRNIVPKNKLIDCVLDVIPYSQALMNSKRIHKDSSEESFEDYLLVNLVAVSMCLSGEEFAVLETKLCEAVLGDNCSKAVFATHYWVLLAKLMDPQYTVSTVTSLCEMFGNLELNSLFKNSPQEIQLGQTIRRLFEILPSHYKVLIKKQFDIEKKHCSLWSFIKIKNLPENIRVETEQNLLENLTFALNKLTNCKQYKENDIQHLIEIMKVTSTCSFAEVNSDIIDCVLKSWVKVCPKNLFLLPMDIERGVFWFYSFIEALVLLTNEIIEQFVYFENVLTVFNIISKLILTGNNELIMLLIPFYCKISLCFFADESDLSVEQNTNETFKFLLLKKGPLIQTYTLVELFKYSDEKEFKNIVGIINTSPELQKMWQQICNKNKNDFHKQWMLLADNKYIHKCMDNKVPQLVKEKKKNFEMDIDDLFAYESSEEPANKKLKLEDLQTRDIVKRLENDALLLSKTNHISDECRKRISVVCDTLTNIIS